MNKSLNKSQNVYKISIEKPVNYFMNQLGQVKKLYCEYSLLFCQIVLRINVFRARPTG